VTDNKLGIRQRTLLAHMCRHGGRWPHTVIRAADRQMLESLEQRGIIEHHPDTGQWTVKGLHPPDGRWPAPHGTRAAAAQHRADHEPLCRYCRDAEARP
jgi:hypothetical protein